MTLTSSAKVADIIASLQGSMGTMSKADLVSVVGGDATTADSIGTVVTKLNTQKNTLVDLANEAVANNNVLKANLANAIGSPAVGTDSMTQLTQYIINRNKVGSATIITPSTADQVIPQGYYGGAVGDGKVSGDVNLIPGNILSGVSIFGIAGTLGSLVAGPNDWIKITKSGGGTSITTPTLMNEVKIISGSGTIRVNQYLYISLNNGTTHIQVYKNGTAVGVDHTATAINGYNFSDDISVVPNDLVQVYAWGPSGGAFSARMSSISLSSAVCLFQYDI
ncbi:MAG: hypothetical protein Q8910_00955 [Bacteroidota bacterium]|nr:hypothetical protein [Bacteroidota bacterium]